MKELGENFSKSGIEVHGFSSLDNVFWNLNQEDIYKIILDRGEGKVSKDGAMVVKTGIHTGRSAQDKFVVKESKNKDSIWWDNAKEMSEENFLRFKILWGEAILCSGSPIAIPIVFLPTSSPISRFPAFICVIVSSMLQIVMSRVSTYQLYTKE